MSLLKCVTLRLELATASQRSVFVLIGQEVDVSPLTEESMSSRLIEDLRSLKDVRLHPGADASLVNALASNEADLIEVAQRLFVRHGIPPMVRVRWGRIRDLKKDHR